MPAQRMADGGLLWHPSLVSPSLLRTVEHWSGQEAHHQVSALQPPQRCSLQPNKACSKSNNRQLLLNKCIYANSTRS